MHSCYLWSVQYFSRGYKQTSSVIECSNVCVILLHNYWPIKMRRGNIILHNRFSFFSRIFIVTYNKLQQNIMHVNDLDNISTNFLIVIFINCMISSSLTTILKFMVIIISTFYNNSKQSRLN